MKFAVIALTILTTAAFAQGVITDVQGKVEVQLPGQTRWVAAAVDMRLPVEATLSTGFNSSATIRLNASTLRLRPMTRITLQALEAENTQINLRVGTVQSEVRRGDARELNFSIRSPQATASVRGTDFEMSPFELRTFSGEVLFESRGARVLVDAGTRSSIDALGLPEAPLQSLIPESVLDRLAGALEALQRQRPSFTSSVVISVD